MTERAKKKEDEGERKNERRKMRERAQKSVVNVRLVVGLISRYHCDTPM